MKFRPTQICSSIRLTVVAVFILATTLIATVAIGLQYYFSASMARDAATNLYTATANNVALKLEGINRINSSVIALLADNSDLQSPHRKMAQIKFFTKVLQENPLLYGVYVGRPDGTLFEVINLNTNPNARKKLLALPSDRWVTLSVRNMDGGQQRIFRYLDDGLKPRATRSEPASYNATIRPWYRKAIDSGRVEISDPYLFSHLGVPGYTVSKQLTNRKGVVGIDMTLSTISHYLDSLRVSDNSDIYLYNAEGLVVASDVSHQQQSRTPPAPKIVLTPDERAYLSSLGTLKSSSEQDWPPIDYTQQGKPSGYSIDLVSTLAKSLGIPVKFVNGYTWPELVKMFREGELDLLHSVALTDNNRAWGLPGKSYVSLPFAVLTRKGAPPVHSLDDLNGKTLAIPSGWSILPLVRKAHPRLNILEVSSTLDGIKKVAAGKADAMLDMGAIMRYLVRHYYIEGVVFNDDISMGLAHTPDKLHIFSASDKPMLRKLLDRAIDAALEQRSEELNDKWLTGGGSKEQSYAQTVPSKVLLNIAHAPELRGKLAETSIHGKQYFIYATQTGRSASNSLYIGILTPVNTVMAPFKEKITFSILITAALLLLLLPMSWLFANPIVRPVRLLADENDKVRRLKFNEVRLVPTHIRELGELSESMVKMSDSIQAHQLAQRELMDAIIQLIARAIDDKSPYTAGHCERVPELALMLADAATRSEATAFKEFQLDDETQWREYRTAAWLHDCGKITTPEHVVDKGSKLETIYNRIHEIRMRFEVLFRDAELAYLKKLMESPEKQQQLQAELTSQQAQLQSDFKFVAECNIGGEFLDDDKKQRLTEIGEKRWLRQFDDRIGLSPVEERRLPEGEASSLPVTEKLLADKPEHITLHSGSDSTDYDSKFGINMQRPEHLYNQGEIYNLSISRGTLTPEERFKINEHINSTIGMLESLPFPEEMKNVPRYASTHHEAMDGSGYPRQLSGEQLSIPERLLCIADIFEALTASDRPYKKANSISVAIDILYKKVQNKQIDRDCFELFLTEGVYLKYAERYLDREQIDEVEIARYLKQ
ncbi:HD domain-containing phosphohydrolase [Dongshaea marina]|uniref:HD domain-containing phosphohydrolase n=1 Tax=Dongshaea marina TaxID=2047966 RepID=UPI00131F002B|nr:HD domain-containing phosphohydrolase [Dongshaea marina]